MEKNDSIIENAYKATKCERVQRVVSWLENQNITVEDDFRKKLLDSPSFKSIPDETYQSILKMCEYFTKYVTQQEEIGKLVKNCVYTMALYQTSVISTNKGLSYIGNLAELNPNIEIPEYITGIVNYFGVIQFQERRGGPLRRV